MSPTSFSFTYPSLESVQRNPELVAVLHDLFHFPLPQIPFTGVFLHHQNAPLTLYLLGQFRKLAKLGVHITRQTGAGLNRSSCLGTLEFFLRKTIPSGQEEEKAGRWSDTGSNPILKLGFNATPTSKTVSI